MILMASTLIISSWIIVKSDLITLPSTESKRFPAELAEPFQSTILITIDTLRGDYLGFSGHPDVRTPTLDALSQGMTLFSEAYTNFPLTVPAHCAMLTSLYPRETGVRQNTHRLASKYITVQETLRDKGIATAAFPLGILQFPRGLEEGFELYSDMKTRPRVKRDQHNPKILQPVNTPKVHSEVKRMKRVTDWIREKDARGQRYFVWLHVFEPHLPYKPARPIRYIEQEFSPESTDSMIYDLQPTWHEYGRSFSADEVKVSRQLYQNEALWTDQLLRPLLLCLSNELNRKPFLLITADHGETLHDSTEYFGHGFHVTREELHIPFLAGAVAPQQSVSGRIIPSLVQSVDVAPTILSAMGFKSPTHYRGMNVLNHTGEDRIIPFSCELKVSAYGALNSHYKSVFDTQTREWTDWDVMADPAERSKLKQFDLQPEGADLRCLQTVRAFANTYADIVTEAVVDPMDGHDDPDFLSMLEQLGYIQ